MEEGLGYVDNASGAVERGGRWGGPSLARPSVSTLLFAALALAFLFFLATRFDVDAGAIRQIIVQSDPVFLSLGLAVYYLSFLVRGLRWRYIMRNVASAGEEMGRVPSVLECAQYILLARFADSIALLRLGNVYRAFLASDSKEGSFSRTIGTLVAEHFLDILVVFAALAVLGALLAAQGGPIPLAWAIAVAFAAAAIATVGLLLMGRLGPALARRLPRRLAGAYRHFHHGTLSSLGIRQAPVLIVLSVLGWLSAVARWYFVLAALGISLSLPMVFFVSLVNVVLAAVPLTPGGLGVVEPGVAGVLALRLSTEAAVSLTILERSISYASIVLVGAVLLFARELATRWRSSRGSLGADE